MTKSKDKELTRLFRNKFRAALDFSILLFCLSTCLVLLIGGIRYIERIKGKDMKGNKNYFEFYTEVKISVNV